MHREDKEFRHPGVSYLDYKQLEMDRVLTGLLPRLWFHGQSSVVRRTRELDVDTFVRTFMDNPGSFAGFDRDTAHRWLETHLLDVVNRGKSTQAVAGLRPLHGFTYRFRNARRSRPYGADEQLYTMLKHASGGRGGMAVEILRTFFFDGADRRTEAPPLGEDIDVETQALISLSEAERTAVTDHGDRKGKNARSYPPLYPEASDLLADDVLRLLRHRGLVPRGVLIDYMKILFAFHLALYHLRIMKLLPALVKGTADGSGGGLFLDVEAIGGTRVARLAERSAAAWLSRIPEFVRATFVVKKLDDFSGYLVKLGERKPVDDVARVGDLLALLGPAYVEHRGQFFGRRRVRVMDDLRTAEGELDERSSQILELAADEFTQYIELITAERVSFHRKYLTECLDSLLLKNRPGAMITQPKQGARRFILDSRLLEVLLQLSLLRPGDDGDLRTASLRVDEFLMLLRNRYGLYIDELPPGDGFGPADITDQAALRANRAAFTARLREIGFYSDLSDAYLTQTITPRYVIGSPR
jgi:hypothetical protein